MEGAGVGEGSVMEGAGVGEGSVYTQHKYR